MKTDLFDFELPQEAIALRPAEPRDSARLLVVRPDAEPELEDRIMRDLAREYPGYGWEQNVGYCTGDHQEALRRLGPTPHHRRNYKPVKAQLPEQLDLSF